MTVLPDGYTLQRPADADLPRIQRLVDAYESWLCGETRVSEDEVSAEVADPDSDIAHNWWVVESEVDPGAATRV